MRRQPLPHPLLSLGKNNGLPLLFLLLIFLPLADMTFRVVQTVPVNEKRKMAVKPEFQPMRPWDFAKKYEAYFNDHFGVRYAPNTRETVRRQTVHQFLQAGLILAHPDDPSRPVNSPDTRYQIESSALKLIKSYGST